VYKSETHCSKKEGFKLAKFASKYYIEGQDLKSYCSSNGYNYSSARNMISSDKKKHPEWTTEEILADVKSRLKKGKTKYFFRNTTLNAYCLKNGVVSSTVRRKYNEICGNSKYNGLSNDEMMLIAIEEAKVGHEKYRIDGVLLSVYCSLNDINKGTIINKINKYKKENPNSLLSDNEIAKMAVMDYYKGHAIYFVGDEVLHIYVTKLGYLPSTVLRKMHLMYPETVPSGTRERIIVSEEKLLNVLNSIGCVNGTLYFFGGMSLKQYCKENNINYGSVVAAINIHSELSIDEIVARAISNRDKRIRQKDRIMLKSREQNGEFVNYYIKKYGIDEDSFKLARKHFGVFVSINIIEYFGIVNDEIIANIKALLQNSENSFDDAVLLNSLGFNNWAYYIVKGLKGMIINTINSLNVSIKKYDEYREYLEEFIYSVIVDKCYLFTPGGLISYFGKTLRPRLIDHIQNEHRQDISLNDQLYCECCNCEHKSEEERANILRESLDDLNEWELNFIYKRFGFYSSPMSIADLQKSFYSEYSLDELKSIETAILYKLGNNDNLKKLII